MNILITVEHYFPHIGGAGEVVRNVAKRLVQRGHKVTVATSEMAERREDLFEGVEIVGFKITGNLVKGIKGEVERFRSLLLSGSFDIVANYAAQCWPTDLTFHILDRVPAKKVLWPCGYSGLKVLHKRPFYWNYFRKLPFFLKQYDHIVYHSSDYMDKVYGDKHGINNYSIIPNGISDIEMERRSIDFRNFYNIKTPYMLFNVSHHYRLKGHSFVLEAYNRLNRSDTSLVIIGNNIPGIAGCYTKCTRLSARNSRVRLLECVPREHVISAFHESNVFVSGSKVECFPLVVLEAMSTGVPFVSTDVGCVKHLSGGVIVSSPKDMAYYVNRLLDDSELRERLSTEGKGMCKNYRWDNIVLDYEKLFLSMLNGRTSF